MAHVDGDKIQHEEKIPPPVIWAQRKDKIFLTITVDDCKDAEIKLHEDKLYFSGHGSADKKHYEGTIEFFKPINPSESKYVVLPRNIPMVLKKLDSGPYWDRLLKDCKKVHWLKTDFDKWADEDDSDAEPENDSRFEEMMQQMGNFQSPNNDFEDDDKEPDSDDDEGLPDLE